MKEMVQKYTDKPEKVRIIEGGKERMDSIHNVTDIHCKRIKDSTGTGRLEWKKQQRRKSIL